MPHDPIHDPNLQPDREPDREPAPASPPDASRSASRAPAPGRRGAARAGGSAGPEGEEDEPERAASGAPATGRAIHDAFSTDEIFQRITATAGEEVDRPSRPTLLSGIAAGLSIGITFLARIALSGQIDPEAPGARGALLYPVGFILIAIGRYQLFTENTLTPVTLVLMRKTSIPALLRVWGLALAGNLIGVGLVAWLTTVPHVLTEDAARTAVVLGTHALEIPPLALFLKAQAAGFLVASMVWLLHAARSAIGRIAIIYLLMLLIPVADLYHSIIGACEALHVVFRGEAALGEAARFFGVVLAGNIVGGVVLVALLNFGQTSRGPEADDPQHRPVLPWRRFLLGDR